MLKKIRVDQLSLGMHVHELEGSWLSHPFWKTKFLLRDPGDLRKLLDSGVQECWIDVSKGADVVTAAAEPAPAPAEAPAVPRVAPEPKAAAESRASARREPSTSFTEETQRAAAIVTQSRQAVMALFAEARMGRALDTQQCIELVDEVAASVWRNPGALVTLARLKTHDDYSYMHSVAVCALMVALAREMGLSEAQSREAGVAGLLHDTGKALMPLEILNKPGKLTDHEFTVMKGHPQAGYDLLKDSTAVPPSALDVCLHHHEKTDGTGYPFGLKDQQISTLAKMGAVCDVYDAITSNRPYKDGWDPADSIAKMASWCKGHFDEAVFQSFVKSLGIYPIGSLVRLQSGRIGVVVDQNASSMVAPKVKVFFSTKSNMPVAVEVIDLAASGCNDRIVSRESNAQWKFKHINELWAGPEVLRKLGH
jgi:HD-GYP domain-containing protein (c-di-GMP phosphodiesterase class II)